MKAFRKQLWITTIVVTLMAAVALMAVLLLTSVVGHVAASGPAGPELQDGSETEPNDTPAQANAILVNESLVGQVPAANPSDIDYFVLTAEQGRSYEVRLDESAVSADYQFRLALLDGNQSLVDDAETWGGNALLLWAASTVTYFFRVDAAFIYTDDAPYEIRVVPLTVGPICDVPGDYSAIQAAVAGPACGTVNVGAGTFYESVTISRTVTLQGQGADLTIVEGEEMDSYIFWIEDSGVVTLTGMTLQNLQAGPGSAIMNGGTALVADCTLSGNLSWVGGGIANWGTMIVTGSSLRENWAYGCAPMPGLGGGIANVGTMTVTDSTLSGNSAATDETDSGGGIGLGSALSLFW